MGKVRTQCQCGGTFDGTPSGRKRHERTAQHQDWSAGQLASHLKARAEEDGLPTADALVASTAMPEFPWERLPDGKFRAPALPEAVGDNMDASRNVAQRISSIETALARRTKDYEWRVRHATPEQAEAYRTAKVVPLEEDLRLAKDGSDVLREDFEALMDEYNRPVQEFFAAVVDKVAALADDSVSVEASGLGRNHWSAPEVRFTALDHTGKRVFGGEATVIFPNAGWTDGGETFAFEPACVRWGSIGPWMDIATGEALIKVQSLAIAAAKLLNTLYGI